MQNKSGNNSHSGSHTSENKSKNGMETVQLMKLFEDELKDIYWAEKALTKAIPKMLRNATNEQLVLALRDHLNETEEQVKRVEHVFEILGKKATAKKCEAMN